MRWIVAVLVALSGAACGDNLAPPAESCTIAAPYTSAALQELSADGQYLLFRDGAEVLVTSTGCGSAPIHLGGVAYPRFCGDAVLGFGEANPDEAGILYGWAPGMKSASAIGPAADPGATHCSPDGRYASTELDDEMGDGESFVQLALVRTDTLSVTNVIDADRPRGRFTHDSQFLVYSTGVMGELRRVTLDGIDAGSLGPAPLTRWQISNDDQWIISSSFGVLRKQRLSSTPDSVDLVTDVSDIQGPDFILSSEGDAIAYARQWGLEILSLSEGTPRMLDIGVDPLIARFDQHFAGWLTYQQGSVGAVVATSGAQPPYLGASITDRLDGDVLIVHPSATDGRPELLHVPHDSADAIPIATDVTQGAFTSDGWILAKTADAQPAIRLLVPHDLILVYDAVVDVPGFLVDATHHFIVAAVQTPLGIELRRVTLPHE